MYELDMKVASVEQQDRYPKHGWAANSQNIKLLWFPILSMLKDTRIIRERKGASTPIAASFTHDNDRFLFCDTLRKHVVALRELHRIAGAACQHPFNWQMETEDGDRARHVANELCPLFADLAIVYLRRLADRLTISVAPSLFDTYRSAPRAYKMLVEKAGSGALRCLRPICDIDVLERTILENSGWFASLRSQTDSGKKGVRDAAEHRGVVLWPSFTQVGEKKPTFELSLQSAAPDVERISDVLVFISHCNAGFCSLLSGICKAAGWVGSYARRDLMFSVGNDDDIVAFWPPL